MIVARRFALDRRAATGVWIVGIVALMVISAAFWPSIEGTRSFDELVEDLPASVRALIGAHGEVSLGTPAGYLNARLFATVLPVLLTVFGISVGARALASSEEDGTLELLLSNPISRSRVAVERGATALALLGVLGAVALLALIAVGAPVGLLEGVSVPRLAAACAGIALLAAFHGTISFTIGAATGRHGLAVAIAGIVAVAGYLLEGLLSASGALAWLRWASPWHWLLGRNVLVQGIPLAPLIVQFVIGAVLVAGGVLRFAERDLR